MLNSIEIDHANNIKMPTIVGILKFTSMIIQHLRVRKHELFYFLVFSFLWAVEILCSVDQLSMIFFINSRQDLLTLLKARYVVFISSSETDLSMKKFHNLRAWFPITFDAEPEDRDGSRISR